MRGPIKTQALEILRKRAIPVGTVVDVGVLTQTGELIKAYPDRKHLLFEPVEEFFPTISKNYSNIDHELLHYAVSDASGVARMRMIYKGSEGDITHSQITDDESGEVKYREVPKTSLDDFFAQRADPDPFLLKIDVDGHELSILDGAAQTLRRSSIVIIEAFKWRIAEIVSRLTSVGFHLFDMVEPCYYDDAIWQFDLIFIGDKYFQEAFQSINVNYDASKYKMFTG